MAALERAYPDVVSPRSLVQLVVWVIGFPLAWPLSALRRAILVAAHERLLARRRPDDGLARVSRGEVVRALVSARVVSTMASGPEEDACVVLVSRSGEVVVDWSPALVEVLVARGVPVCRREVHQLGIASFFGWGLWIVSTLLLAALVTHHVVPLVLAAVVFAALVALALS